MESKPHLNIPACPRLSYVLLQPCMCPDLSSHLFPAPFPASMAIRTFIQHFAEAVAWSCLPGVRPLITGHTDFTPEHISGGPRLNPWVLAQFRQMLSIWKTLNFIKKKKTQPYLLHIYPTIYSKKLVLLQSAGSPWKAQLPWQKS